VIVWLNGPFGVGKTAVAEALLDAKPDWSLLDPEERGVELLRTAPDVDDFQDLPAWRTSFVEDALARDGSTDLVIPMTVWRLDHYREILDGMKSATEVRPIRLTASEVVLRERIAGDRLQPTATPWRLHHLDACVDAFDDPVFGDHIGTDGRTPAKIATLILVMIGRA
jgi:hypothetical protein